MVRRPARSCCTYDAVTPGCKVLVLAIELSGSHQMKKRRSGAIRGLAQVGTRKKPDGSTFGDVLNSLGDRSFGWAFILVGFTNMLPLPPGANLVLGLPILFIAMQMALGRPTLWLPGFVTRRFISRALACRCLDGASIARPLRASRMRYTSLFRGRAERLLGMLMLVTGVVLCSYRSPAGCRHFLLRGRHRSG